MILYSDTNQHYSHRIRIALAEKDVTAEFKPLSELPEKLVNELPFTDYQFPVLVDKGLFLYESVVILEYLDERYPHPPLLPVYPLLKAHIRQIINKLENEFSGCVDKLLVCEDVHSSKVEHERSQLEPFIHEMEKKLEKDRYFMGNEFSLIDCYLAPIFWRLHLLGISDRKLPAIQSYLRLISSRDCFRKSLSESEMDMH